MKKGLSLSRILMIVCIATVLMSTGISVYAANVSKARHPNLAAAQKFTEKAITKVSEAQKANEFDMSGHAAKAKTLLEQAYAEIKLAAEAANVNK